MRVLAAITFGVVSAWSRAASAQSQTSLERFEPPPPSDPSAVFASAGVDGSLRPSFGASLVYANAPLVLVRDATGDEARAVVEHQLVLHVLASLAIASRALVEIDFPTSLLLTGDDATTDTAGYGAPSGATQGDLRVGGRFEALEQNGWIPSAAFGLAVWLPTGDESKYTSTGGVRFAPSLSVSGDYDSWLFGVTLARRFEPNGSSDHNLLGSDLELTAGAGARVDRFTFGGAILTGFVTADSVDAFRRRAATRVEILAEARAKFGPVDVSLFGGPGLTRSPGTPLFRLGLATTVAFDVIDDHATTSADGAAASRDADASGNGGAKGGPPTRHDPAPMPREPDRDGDGLADSLDACPDVPGPVLGGPMDGCPVDTDGDHVPDASDACPREAGPENDDPKKNGCPGGAAVSGEHIAIFSPIEFATGKADILPVSEPVLSRVVEILQTHPELARVAVDGHTDGKGAAKKNLELSRARALSVERWLTEHGVDARRLEARGFGAKQPIADNATEEGRAKNRRVEFVILRRSEDGENGWVDGTLVPEEKKP